MLSSYCRSKFSSKTKHSSDWFYVATILDITLKNKRGKGIQKPNYKKKSHIKEGYPLNVLSYTIKLYSLNFRLNFSNWVHFVALIRLKTSPNVNEKLNLIWTIWHQNCVTSPEHYLTNERNIGFIKLWL